MREFIIANANREDMGVLTKKCDIDVDVGKTNDFQLVIPLSEYNPEIHKAGNILYCLGTEYGGILNNPKVDTKNGTITFTGDSPRGMLTKKIIEPPAGEDYRTTENTPIGTLMYTLLNIYSFGDLIKAILNLSSPIVNNQKYDRYSTLLDGITKILSQFNYRIEIKAVYDSNGKVQWQISTVPIVDYTEQIETSQDCNVEFVIQQNTFKYNHMICAGKGELKNRTIIHLYLQADGSIGTTQYFTGAYERTYFYDYSAVESTDELQKSGIAKFAEINASDTQSMTYDGFEVEIGDIVGGRDYTTGIAISEKVTNKIYKFKYGVESLEYKVGE